jgi:hypothetical protein
MKFYKMALYMLSQQKRDNHSLKSKIDSRATENLLRSKQLKASSREEQVILDRSRKQVIKPTNKEASQRNLTNLLAVREVCPETFKDINMKKLREVSTLDKVTIRQMLCQRISSLLTNQRNHH